MNLAIVGSRTFDNYAQLSRTVQFWFPRLSPRVDTIISGGAKGADALGERFALDNGYQLKVFEAKWKNGRSAGPIRNKLIVEAADAVIAFWDGKSNGTKHTIALARKANKRCVVITV